MVKILKGRLKKAHECSHRAMRLASNHHEASPMPHPRNSSYRLLPIQVLSCRSVAALLSLVGLTFALVAPVSASVDLHRRIPIPRGWKTYSMDHLAISIPGNWVVERKNQCPNPVAKGTLFLGILGKSSYCTLLHVAPNVVSLHGFPEDFNFRLGTCPPIVVNSLTVYFGPCSSSNATGATVWSIPALRVSVIAYQSGGSSVGGGSDSVVGRILRTIRQV
jgi:hypothetical protein